MAKDVNQQVLENLQNLVIISLSKGGANQQQIRSIVGVDANRIARIAKSIKQSRKNEDE